MAQKKMQDDILDEWELTKKMPRKMKKARRKQLLRQWQITKYNPMERN